MRRAALIAVIGALVSGVLSLVSPGVATAAAVSATATGVDLEGAGSCGPNPQMLLSGVGEGDDFGEAGGATLAGESPPTIAITASALFDDWTFEGQGFGLVPSSAPGAGDLVAGYAVIGNPELTVAAEWFALWRCGPGVDSGTLVYSCAGPFGSCPTSVDEAQALQASVTPDAAPPGGTFTVTIQGCHGGDVAAGLWVPFAADPVVSTGPLATGPAPLVATLTVPAGAEPTDAAAVVVVCSLDEQVVALDVQITGPATPPSSVVPIETVPSFTG